MARTLRARTGFVLHWACSSGALLAALSVPTNCTAATAAIAETSHPYAAPVAEASQRFGIPERWIWRVMHAESRSEEHTSELQSLMRISYAVFCLKKKIISTIHNSES